ncbi:universal stress protein [Streptomyces bambusae]|uniref:universal stress protein n=1 Tax=Streptomyces bambusae TaxID=1550616 RepID=UPI001CFCC90F|nr:universal stress protein [Streptomyces bambusae]MCB5167470.1 universal stress protein [Streptomyces bambusae]
MTQDLPRRIIVGLSGSLESFTALHRAVAEARRCGAEVLAVLAVPPTAHTPEQVVAERQLGERLLSSLLEDAFGAAAPPGVRFSAVSLLGGAGPVLTGVADREGDLLVVGAPRRRLRFPGTSTARHCAARATCPVLVVPLPFAAAVPAGPQTTATL